MTFFLNYRGKDFRDCYLRIKEIRAILMPGVPLMALTATANKRTMGFIVDNLEMDNCLVVKGTNDKKNIYYSVKRLPPCAPQDILKQESIYHATFGSLINNLIVKGTDTDKTLIFCYSKLECSNILDYFEQHLGDKLYSGDCRIVNIYTNITDDLTKSRILESFSDPNGVLRVVIATVAFGLGVDCPNIREVIHFRSPASMLDYVQESGRAGRDGQNSKATLFFSAREFGSRRSKFNKNKTKYQAEILELEKISNYCENTTVCRRKLILEYFEESHVRYDHDSGHNCCDICSLNCACSDCEICIQAENLDVTDAANSSCTIEAVRNCSTDSKIQIRKELMEYRQSLGNEVLIFGTSYSTGFTEHLIDQICEKADYFLCVNDILKLTDIWTQEQAEKVMKIVEKHSETLI